MRFDGIERRKAASLEMMFYAEGFAGMQPLAQWR